ncbi:hypothetical protein BT96DRAFT_989070 [Gymnopus androsaceus JB14]|uniref:Major facilitator superfamily (MFS) profile domain-containing protein n=1 Tax=Gymnopus androsaceus JB14 TaxID=1447944 RepID=A0A6A4I2K2_9AGAR|nr:hypothetical protein BT96DRAFT_989070 [Gymnopus androsaceus JB14]
MLNTSLLFEGQSTQNKWASFHAIALIVIAALGTIIHSTDPAISRGLTAIDNFWLIRFPAYDTGSGEGTTTLYTHLTSCQLWLKALFLFFFAAGGVLFGGAISRAPADWLGHRWTIITSCLVLCVGVIMQQVPFDSTEIQSVIVGHFLAGLGIGAAAVTVVRYESEWIRRGQQASSVYLIAFGIINLFWALILSTSIFLLPESPRWLVRQGNLDGATRSLTRLTELPISDPEIEAELESIKASLESKSFSIVPTKNFLA